MIVATPLSAEISHQSAKSSYSVQFMSDNPLLCKSIHIPNSPHAFGKVKRGVLPFQGPPSCTGLPKWLKKGAGAAEALPGVRVS